LRAETHSPFSEVLKAIRENEARATSLGYKTDRYKLIAFVLSATLAGLAGSTKAIVLQLACAPSCGQLQKPTCAVRRDGRVEDGRGSLWPMANAPFPIPAHRTGRADLRHPALRLASSQGGRRCR